MEISKRIEEQIVDAYSKFEGPTLLLMSLNTHDEFVKELARYSFQPIQELKLQNYRGLRVIPSEALSDEEIIVK